MIPSDKICGTCNQAMLLKAFRGADVYVCQQCRMVSLSKGDFKTLLQTPATPAPAEPRDVQEVQVVEERASPRPQRISGPQRSAPVSTGPSMPPGTRAPSMDLGDTTAALSRNDGPALELGYDGTEETEEFERGPHVGTMAKTEIAGPDDDAVYGSRPSSELSEPGLPFDGVQDLSADPDPYAGYEVQDVDDDGFEAELAAYQARRRRSVVLASLAFAAVLIVVVVIGAGAGMAGLFAATDPTQTPAGTDTPDTPEPAAPSEPEPAEAPAPAAPSEPEPAGTDTPDTPEPAAPSKPEPEPAAPAPTPAGRSKVQSLVEQGWNRFDSDPDVARQRFESALAIDPNHADANYGYGYALLKQGQATASIPYLCRAQRTGDAESARDIRALLSQNGLSCEGL